MSVPTAITFCVTSSGGPAVLVDHAAEPIRAHQFAARRRRVLGRRAGQSLLQPLMRPSVVVVLDEHGQHTLQMPAAEDPGRWSRHSRRAVPTNLSAMEFARGER